MAKGKRHEWRERTEDRETRIYRAWYHGGKWTMQETLKSEPDWRTLDPIPLAELRKLRAKIWEKYQRNRVPYKNIEQLDALIEEAEELEPKAPPKLESEESLGEQDAEGQSVVATVDWGDEEEE